MYVIFYYKSCKDIIHNIIQKNPGVFIRLIIVKIQFVRRFVADCIAASRPKNNEYVNKKLVLSNRKRVSFSNITLYLI